MAQDGVMERYGAKWRERERAARMEELTATVKNALLALGADIVGFGDISELPPNVREGLPVGISIAVKYPKAVIFNHEAKPGSSQGRQSRQVNQKNIRTTRFAGRLTGLALCINIASCY
jgi:hypothetical protein